MFEIDAVNRGIEHQASIEHQVTYAYVDKLTGAYTDMIDAATRPVHAVANLAFNLAVIDDRRRILQKEQGFIEMMLTQNQDIAELYPDHNGRTLLEAYSATLVDVNDIVSDAQAQL